MASKKPTAWEKRKRRVMGDDPDDPSLSLPAGEWVVDRNGVRRFVTKQPQK